MHEPLAEVLLEKLCTAVQKVQEEFASGQGIIKDGEAVSQLCQSVDNIFSHGLKERILNWASGTETTYWPLVVKITYKEVIQDILSRTSLKNDKERCQVWVRVAAHENALGSYLNIITQDDKLLRDFYHPHAFVFDEVKVDTAKTALLYGLSHLDFNISLDIPDQISPIKKVERQEHIAASAPTIIPDKSSTANGYYFSYSSSMTYPENISQSPHNSLTKPKKKKKKVKSSVAEIADSFDENNDSRLTSVERYMYMTSSMNDSKKDIQNDSLRDVDTNMDSLSSIQLTRTLSGGFESTAKAETFEPGNTCELSSLGALNDASENKNVEGLRKKLDDIYFESDGAVSADVRQDEREQRELDKTEEEDTIEEDTIEEDTIEEDSFSNQQAKFSENKTDFENKESDMGKENADGTMNDFSGKIEELSENTTQTFGDSEIRNTEKEEEEEACERNVENVKEPFVQTLADEEPKSELSDNKGQSDLGTRLEEIKDEVEYKVSCARYEFGTPTETSCEEDAEQNKNRLTPEEDEDLNFIPGIHKDDDWRSLSGSNSFTGSGSFSQPKSLGEKVQRTSTIDSTKSSSSVSGSMSSDMWRFVDDASERRKDSRADDMSVATEDSFSDLGIFEELLGMEEDHFSTPDNFMGFSTSEELEHAIHSCKDMIRTAPQNSPERKQLVEKLIQLRVKLQETKEESTFVKIPDAKKILGHQFVKEQGARTTDSRLCDRCGKWIWTMWQSLFICKACSFCSHRKCLELIRRPCASRKVSVSTYNLSISPECGLNVQQYKCVECRKRISLSKSTENSEARLCDYSGQFFCEDCHWNDQVVIPARVIHNWDFSPYKVSRQTKQFLDLMIKKPLLDLEQVNPALFKFVGELREIKRLREEILIMKKYFMTCRMALESKLLLHLKDRQHFVDNSNVYSLQDILEVENGTMLPFVTRVHSLFLTHIKSDCELCQAKGFVCEICKANDIIFAFDSHVVQCAKCRTVFHKLCFKKDSCPKCQRIRQRTSK